ncbi:MAG: lolE 2 [Gammaproteobacteria bacterium]|jgi:lipoprotein-releasing system permease protein|nr:lolE 2 [Gammaproteobacteria bacterium]
MFKPLSLYIGLRYLRAKRRNHFISFISLTSMLGIALGVTVLITVISVMNGFDQVIRERMFSMAQHVTVSTLSTKMNNWQAVQKQLAQKQGVVATAPLVYGQGILVHAGLNHPAVITGILPQEQQKVSSIADKMVEGSLTALRPGQFGIVLGQQLADSLVLNVGDSVTLITPDATVTPAGILPRFKTFKVVGIFKVGSGFDFDNNLGFIDLQDGQRLFKLGQAISAIQLKLKDLYQAPDLARHLSQALPSDFVVSDWTQTYGALSEAISMEKRMIFLMLLLIVWVAAFNLVSTLVMVVTDKQADIAILRTLGATPGKVMAIFMVQGSASGIIGTLLGLIGGLLLASHVTEVVNLIETIFHVQLLSSSIYYVNYLPSKIQSGDVITVCSLALLFSLLATLYPAWRAARIQPAEALRYE